MTDFEVFKIILILYVLYLLVTLLLSYRMRMQLRHQIRLSTTRSHFAEIRNDLLMYGAENKIDTKSFLFGLLYSECTFVMRRPDEYAEIADAFAKLSAKPPNQKYFEFEKILECESETCTPEIHDLLMRKSDGLMMLMFDYSFALRLGRNIVIVLRQLGILPFVQAWITALKEQQIERDRVTRTLNDARKYTHDLCAA